MRPQFLALLIALISAKAAAAPDRCVRIYYDRAPAVSPDYVFGRTHALYLQNLLGHFPEVQQIIAPIETYKAGDLDTCRASIYLGTYYNNPGLPPAFLEDYKATRRNVLWSGYNVWALGPDTLDALFKVNFRQLAPLDREHLDEKGQPGFYRFFEYKGETFEKYGSYDIDQPDKFIASSEISLFDFDSAAVAPYVVAWARHSVNGDRQPYVLRNGNHWYVGDSPFSYATEADRYLIFADLLFDVLDEAPRHQTGPRPALIRLEDVHPLVPLWQLNAMRSLFERKQAHYSISMIPLFTDPLGVSVVRPEDRFVAITNRPLFIEWAHQAERGGASFIYHGFTHQYGSQKNPFNGLTGDDFEFWDRIANRPVAKDSVDWVLGRVEDGLSLFDKAGIHPLAWLMPHYQGSALDYRLFGQLFTWNVGRVIYQPFVRVSGADLGASLRMDKAGPAGRQERAAVLKNTTATQPPGLPSGQFFPYEIYGDIYGQRLLPENVGNVQAYMTEQVFATHSVDDLIATMKRNRVLRDAWASLFIHSFLVGESWQEGIGRFAGDTDGIERLIDAARAYGYDFIDLAAWVQDTPELLRKPPIEVFWQGPTAPGRSH